MKKHNKKGFTIVELVIVIAVIAILAAVLIPTFSNVVEKANRNAALQAGRNAYVNAYAEAIADGTTATATDYDIVYADKAGNVLAVNPAAEPASYEWKFTWTSENDCDVEDKYDKYNFSVVDGEFKLSEQP